MLGQTRMLGGAVIGNTVAPQGRWPAFEYVVEPRQPARPEPVVFDFTIYPPVDYSDHGQSTGFNCKGD